MKKNITRRDFIAKTTSAFATFSVVPSFVLGTNGQTPPSEKLNVACVGLGGKGKGDVKGVSSENVVAICDVDKQQIGKVAPENPNAMPYTDYRKMLDDMNKTIDAVVVSTPDNNHAVIAAKAMQMGKHVYVQKPLTHDIFEARKLTEYAKKYKVVTQMGNQNHSNEGMRVLKEWLTDSAIGNVKKIHIWTDRPTCRWGWPQGMKKYPQKPMEKPGNFSWDIWLGPAEDRPFHTDYIWGKWRGWWDFGTGALGDMGCHLMDWPYYALDLDAPETVEASSTEISDVAAPLASMVTYKFPARGNRKALEMIWYDGGLRPSVPDEYEINRKVSDNGMFFEGDKGVMYSDLWSPRIIPETKMKEYKRPPKTLPRVKGGHYQNWINACKNNTKATSDFEYAGPLTETVLLGNLAIRAGKKIQWDSKNMKVTNCPDANQYVQRKYRQGWTL